MLLRELQNELSEPYIEFGVDKIIFMLPKRYLDDELWQDVMGKANAPGNFGKKLILGLHTSVKSLLLNGFNVIIDHVLIEEEWKKDIVEQFSDFKCFLIKVFCPLEELEKREKRRKDRTLGQAKLQYDIVHTGLKYDFEIDTSKYSVEEEAKMIINYINSN